ncbi:MAG: hypothetical protein MJ197_03560 [Bacteroidales bacterium]|nr:hypothetical protein [Bacteroidales bacterium]
MISRIVQEEEERWHRMGFDTVATPMSITVSEALNVYQLGNESYILTGIRIGNNDLMSDDTELELISPTESVQCTQRELSQFGTSIIKLFKNYLIIKTRTKHDNIPSYRLDFIKITPITQTK